MANSVRLLTQDGEKYFAVEGSGTQLDPYSSVQQLSGAVTVTGTVDVGSMPVTTISSLPSVDIASLPSVDVATLPDVTIVDMPEVVISTLPSVTIGSLPSVTVGSLPNVTIATMPNVVVSSLPNVTITAMPNVTIAALPNVVVSTLPNVTLNALPAATTIIGAVLDAGPKNASVRFASYYADAAGGQFMCAAPTGGQKRVFTDIVVSVNTDCYVSLTEETSDTLIVAGWMKASNGFEQLVPRGTLKLPTADKRLKITTSVACEVAVMTLSYSEA